MKIKPCIYIVLLVVAAWSAASAPVITNTPILSIFIMPSNPNEGRDPFFPNSTRPYENAVSKRPADLTSLQIKGYSEFAGHRYVIINNHTFGEGDEGDVMTPGGRIHIRCLSVTDDSVLVEANDVRQLLKYSDQ